MRQLDLRRSHREFWRDLVFLEATLLAHEETRPLAAPLTALLRRHDEEESAEQRMQRGTLQARAQGAVQNQELDEAIRDLHSAALHQVRQNRKEELFRQLFAEPISEITRYGLARQIDVGEQLVGKLQLPAFAGTLRDVHTPALTERITRAKAALERSHAAVLERVGTKMSLYTWKEEANRVRTSIYGQLLGMNKGAAWASAFFLRHAADEKKEPEAPAASTPPAGPAPGAPPSGTAPSGAAGGAPPIAPAPRVPGFPRAPAASTAAPTAPGVATPASPAPPATGAGTTTYVIMAPGTLPTGLLPEGLPAALVSAGAPQVAAAPAAPSAVDPST